MKDNNFIQNQEASLKSITTRSFNEAKRTQKENIAKVKTEEGKKAAMDFIFGTSTSKETEVK